MDWACRLQDRRKKKTHYTSINFSAKIRTTLATRQATNAQIGKCGGSTLNIKRHHPYTTCWAALGRTRTYASIQKQMARPQHPLNFQLTIRPPTKNLVRQYQPHKNKNILIATYVTMRGRDSLSAISYSAPKGSGISMLTSRRLISSP